MGTSFLFYDLETSPNVVLSWRVGYKLNIDQANIVKERAIICIGYKWEGDAKAQVLQWDANQCDKAMLVRFLAIANEADEMVAHNGDKFDPPWFRARCAYHGLQSMPSYKTVDTLQWARRNFYFNSNKLDYIARFLGIGGKIKTEFGLWKSICLERNAKSMKAMTDYCKYDVVLLEKVWGRLAALVGEVFGGTLPVRIRAWDGSEAGPADNPRAIPSTAGITRAVLEDTKVIPYNNLEALERVQP